MVSSDAGSGRDGSSIEVLLVEDNPGDARLVEEAFAAVDSDPTWEMATDGSEAVDLLIRRCEDGAETLPDLVLLDLNLPRMDGFEVLDAIGGDPTLDRLPVLVLTSSRAAEDVRECYDRAANAYLTKPISPDEFDEIARSIEAFWVECAELPPT